MTPEQTPTDATQLCECGKPAVAFRMCADSVRAVIVALIALNILQLIVRLT